jgi:hypothetical protein
MNRELSPAQKRRRDLVLELAGTVCKAPGRLPGECGKTKARGKTFCYDCYMRLPLALRRALYSHMNEGYDRAHEEAIAYFRRKQLDYPEGAF